MRRKGRVPVLAQRAASESPRECAQEGTLPSRLIGKRKEERGGRVEITQQDVEKVALLARLAVSPAERETFAKQLTQILAHVDTLRQYDTTGIEPTATVMGQVNVFREDLVRPSLSSEKALANAPEREADGFVVPKILEER